MLEYNKKMRAFISSPKGGRFSRSRYIEKDKVLLGKTLTCQEFEKYSFYDFSRPYRAIEKGMMPPKLAKIMINLAGAGEDSALLDPFCGSGTILQQALLMGYTKVIGTDIDQRAVDNSKKNLQWLAPSLSSRIPLSSRTNVRDDKEGTSSRVQQGVSLYRCDAQELSKKIPQHSIDAIITEPYLGPLKIGNLKAEIKILSDLYINAFKSFKKVLKSDGRVVIIFPVFSIKNKLHFLPILDTLKKIGWQIRMSLPQYLLDNPVIKTTSRQSIIYSRPNQKILREILIFIL
ncbi:50S ribosomal protein L11 methyltransferase [Patescibacteria group bacterium AH-259-L05]|nr:50S ribosomal protein L11 methyltransferase [Patescibacteria group bacterium AH-259-L05]